MKLVLSRKGFDSSPMCGGCASPILPDGQMISLPIPHASAPIEFAALRHRGLDIGQLVSDLSRSRVKGKNPAHLDPDLDPTARRRRRGWRPAFGQDSAAQRHLALQGVGVGDLFLFFGWFHDVEQVGEHYRYRLDRHSRHVIFGWLRVGQVVRVGRDPIPSWLRVHPHAGHDWTHNTIYVADAPDGGGVFPRFRDELQLTQPGERRRSLWRLPADFSPRQRTALTYHGDPARWTDDGDFCRLQSVAKGQEFVLDLKEYPGVRHWAERLIGQQRGS
jgi:hypothetical protein